MVHRMNVNVLSPTLSLFSHSLFSPIPTLLPHPSSCSLHHSSSFRFSACLSASVPPSPPIQFLSLSLSQPCTLGFLVVFVKNNKEVLWKWGLAVCICHRLQVYNVGFEISIMSGQDACWRFCVRLNQWICASLRLQSGGEVERQLLNAYLAISGKGRAMALLCVDKQGCSDRDSCLTTGAHDNP